MKVKYTDIVNKKDYTKEFTAEYFIADEYLMTLLNELGDNWFSYATMPDAGLKFNKVDGYDQSKVLFAQLIGQTPVGDILNISTTVRTQVTLRKFSTTANMITSLQVLIKK